MNKYQWKLERRRERLEARAAKLQTEGDARVERGMTALRAIPFGQPILVGHHSEKRDRNYRARAGNNIDKGFAMQKQAAELERRAESVGTGGISSDDPEAVTALTEKVVKLEKLQTVMTAANKAIRKGDDDALRALGFNDAKIAALKQPDFCGRIGFASYQLTNNGANIRRIKARITELERAATRETKETERADGVRIVQNADINRLQIIFPGKPPAEARAVLKQYGFRWSPSEGAWQRHLHGHDHHAQWALDAIAKLGGQ